MTGFADDISSKGAGVIFASGGARREMRRNLPNVRSSARFAPTAPSPKSCTCRQVCLLRLANAVVRTS